MPQNMKFIKKIIPLIIAISIIILIISPNIAAWDDCPFGYEDEPYPGKCWRYEDNNNDGICDLSQSDRALTQKTSEQESSSEAQNSSINNQNKFPIIIIISFIIILLIVILAQILKKSGKLSNIKEKIMWNILLLIFFIPSRITGIILALMPSMPALREIGLNFIQLHNITSFFFMWLSGYHIIWHTKYYIKGVKKLIKR